MSAKPRTLKRTKALYLAKGKPANRRITLPDGSKGWVTNARPVYVQRGDGLPSNISTKGGKHYTTSMTDAELERARKTAERLDWTLIERRADIVIKPVDRWAHLDGDLDCDPALLDKLELVGRDLGVIILVRSGRRTMEEQWALYNELGPTIAAYPNPNAPHVRGIAADCGINGVNIGAYAGAVPVMLKHGVCLRVVNENWHVEIGGRSRWAANWLPKGA